MACEKMRILLTSSCGGKTQLCEFLADEKATFEYESKNLKLRKKESMGLLNKAYQEFCLELHLLDHELKILEDGYSMSEQKEKEDLEAIKRLNALSSLEMELVERLEEAKRSVNEIDELESKLRQLHYQINQRNDHFNAKVTLLSSDFMDFIRKLEEKLNTMVENTIKDKELKLHLLPLPYQALFMSGQLGKTWCDSVLKSCENILQQNADIKMNLNATEKESQKIYEDISKSLFSIVTSQQIRQLNSLQQKSALLKTLEQKTVEPSNVLLENEMHSKYMDHLSSLATHLEKETGDLLKNLREVECTIVQHEMSDYEARKDFHMMRIIMQAKDAIIKEL
nr:putative leucine-rich repeat-containing protein DDB_G0290503 isoform X2 [Parasteatoda tepidariorum]